METVIRNDYAFLFVTLLEAGGRKFGFVTARKYHNKSVQRKVFLRTYNALSCPLRQDCWFFGSFQPILYQGVSKNHLPPEFSRSEMTAKPPTNDGKAANK